MAKTSHIAVISIPAFSHQSSIIEFCKKLIHLNKHFHVTCIFPTINAPIPATLTLLESLPPTIHCTFLPPINTQDLPPQDVFLQIQLAVSQSMPSFCNLLRSLCLSTPPLVALVADPFASEALQVAKKEFNLLSYIYFPVSAMTMSLLLHLPTLHEQVSSCEYIHHTEPIQIPGCIPIHGHDLPSDFQDRSSISYELTLQNSTWFSLADGVLVNSFLEMEECTLNRNNNTTTPIYLVGPIIQSGSNSESNGLDSVCVKWLENQRPNSVLYVSFGSGGTLSQQQLKELALGLELSGQKFLWVLRAPSDSDDDDEPLKFLPNGFLERTKEQGFVVPCWAPQTQILSHPSTGGFLTHCGWNSVLESIVHGVPMITWPLFAEQRMNAVLLTEGLKVALTLKFNENGSAERKEIAKAIRDLIMLSEEERSAIRKRIEELKDDAAGALRKDGSSAMALSQFATRLENLSVLPLKQTMKIMESREASENNNIGRMERV